MKARKRSLKNYTKSTNRDAYLKRRSWLMMKGFSEIKKELIYPV